MGYNSEYMGLFGIGSLEFLLVLALALFLVGPRRLVQGIRDIKRFYTDFKRQRDEFTSMVSENLEYKELQKEFSEDAVQGVEELKTAMNLKSEDVLPDEVADVLKEKV